MCWDSRSLSVGSVSLDLSLLVDDVVDVCHLLVGENDGMLWRGLGGEANTVVYVIATRSSYYSLFVDLEEALLSLGEPIDYEGEFLSLACSDPHTFGIRVSKQRSYGVTHFAYAARNFDGALYGEGATV